MPGVHAKLSASGSKKWINCPASAAMEEQFPETESAYAQEGTTAHALGELKLRHEIGEITRVQYHKHADKLDADEEMQDYTDGYRDFVIERYSDVKSRHSDAVLKIEQRLDFSKYVPGGFGTGDAVIVADGELEIIDLKYGRGVSVSAEKNSQLMLYALGALSEYDWLYSADSISMTIYQPRIDNIQTAKTTAEDLYMWGEWVSSRAKIALKDTAFCETGKHCDEGFCKARPICRAYAEERQRLAYLDFKPPNALSTDEVAEVLDAADNLAAWAKVVKEYALSQALNHGIKYPGFKLVEGRSNRAYTDEAKVIRKVTENTAFTEEDIVIRKIKGITDMEKLLGKKTFGEVLGDLVVKPQGNPTLVHSEDKRPEISTNDATMADFEDIIKKGV